MEGGGVAKGDAKSKGINSYDIILIMQECYCFSSRMVNIYVAVLEVLGDHGGCYWPFWKMLSDQ